MIHSRWPVVALGTLLLLTPASGQLVVPSTGPLADPARGGFSAADWSGIRAAHEAARHAAQPVDGGYLLHNPGQGWHTRIDDHGASTVPAAGGWTWGLQLRSYGFAGNESLVVEPASLATDGARMARNWDATLQEWYLNDARGLEHGFTVLQRPPCGEAQRGPLTLTLAVDGTLAPDVDGDGRGVHFLDGTGAVALTYSGLTAFDADGRELAARIERTGDLLHLCVEEDGARYPLTVDPIAQQAYLKASNPGSFDEFGRVIAVSDDTVVVGAELEFSNATGVNGDQANNSLQNAGAAYVFVRTGGTWSQQAYLKASNTGALDQFGRAVAISGDTIVVGAWLEDSSAVGVNGSQADNSALSSGAAYVFVRNGTTWSQQAYLKASNTGANDWFGISVAIAGDGIVVGAYKEASNATGVNGNQLSNSLSGSGAAYVFVRSGTTWTQQAYLKASTSDVDDFFGQSVAISGDTIAVGGTGEDSNATGVNGDENDDSLNRVGAAWVFARSGTTWTQQAYLKPSAVQSNFEDFGQSVSVSGDTVVVGAPNEDSNATGVDGDDDNNGAVNSGAAYVYVRNGATWSQQAYLKASNTGDGDAFGNAVAVSGNAIVVGAWTEDGGATGVNGASDDAAGDAGAAYVFVRNGTTWSQQAYLKASNTGSLDNFGIGVAISGDVVASSAYSEDSNATGVNGNGANNDIPGSGAAYAFDLDLLPEPWADLGFGLAGVSGVPQFVGKGTLIAGDVLALALTNAKPGSSAALLVGVSAIHAPFKGGTLVPAPDLLIAGLPIDGAGAQKLTLIGPAGLPSGATLWMQEWVIDPAGPSGFSASNAITATTP